LEKVDESPNYPDAGAMRKQLAIVSIIIQCRFHDITATDPE
jgi:hypothetical protein